jgi:hypothetical protein
MSLLKSLVTGSSWTVVNCDLEITIDMGSTDPETTLCIHNILGL